MHFHQNLKGKEKSNPYCTVPLGIGMYYFIYHTLCICYSLYYHCCISTNQGPLSCAMDIGCGTGQSTENLLPHFEKVYGCDPSQAMLDQAKEDYKNHGKYFNRSEVHSSLPSYFKHMRLNIAMGLLI